MPSTLRAARKFLDPLFLFCLNAYVCSRLWSADYLDQMGSPAGAFIAFSRYIAGHWNNLQWFPLWFCGMPVLRVYQPGFHFTVAAMATLFNASPPRVYHVVSACVYSLGPVTLYWLCDRLTGRRGYAFAVGLVYSLFSPSLLLASPLSHDTGGWLNARRFYSMVHYGDTPHIAGLAILPLVIWSLHRAILGPMRTRALFIPASAVLLGALVMTNWTATVGLLMALAAYFAAQAGAMRLSGWWTALGIGVLAYLLVCPWLPPSVILDVPANAQYSDGTYFGRTQVVGFAACIVLLGLLHLVLERFHISRDFRFFLYFFLCTGALVLGYYWSNVSLVPQPFRFHLEMEMALIPAVLLPLAVVWDRLRKPVRSAVLILFAAVCLFQLRTYHRFAAFESRPIDISTTIEYRMAKWFEGHTADERVFAPGSVSLWMNEFVDLPQFLGCCDQSIPALGMRLALYEIYTSQNAGAGDAEDSRLWLRAYGVGAVGIDGPGSSEFFKAFANPRKFDGVLPELWRDGDNVVYGLPGRDGSLAHVIWPRQEVQRLPVHGLDVEPLRPYVAALDDLALPRAEMRWLASNRIEISAQVKPGQIVSVQESYAPGWRATANGRTVDVRRDLLGLLAVEPGCAGPCTIELVYDGGAEARWLRALQAVGLLAGFAWPFALLRRNGARAFPPASNSSC